MGTLFDLYAPHHTHCDEAFADAEGAASEGKWDEASSAFARFDAGMKAHLASEEDTLFPAFEAATGMQGGPTMVMRMEHTQMRQLIEAMRQALAAKDGESFGGAAETLLVLMQQHNMKEENMLYPMCDRALQGDAALVDAIAGQLKA